MLLNPYRFTTPVVATDASWATSTSVFNVSTTSFTDDTVTTIDSNTALLQRITLDTFTFTNTDTNVQFWLDWTGGNLKNGNGFYICCMRTDEGTTNSWNTGNSFGYFSTGFAWANQGTGTVLSMPAYGPSYPGAMRFTFEINSGVVSLSTNTNGTIASGTYVDALPAGTFTFMLGQTDPAGSGSTWQIIRARKD